MAPDSVQRQGSGKHTAGIRLFGWHSGYARRRAPRAEFGSGVGSDPRKRGEEIMTKSAHFGSNSCFGLSKAILGYSDGQQSFATMHQPCDSPHARPPYLAPTKPLPLAFL